MLAFGVVRTLMVGARDSRDGGLAEAVYDGAVGGGVLRESAVSESFLWHHIHNSHLREVVEQSRDLVSRHQRVSIALLVVDGHSKTQIRST